MDRIQMAGVTFEYGHHTKWKCIFGCAGLISKGTFAMTEFTLPEKRPSSEQMFDYLERKNPAQTFLEHEFGGVPPWCAKCLAVCAVHHNAKRAKGGKEEVQP